MDSIHPAWLAGFFDGEGSLYIQKPCKGHGAMLRAAISQADNRSLLAIQREYGGTLSTFQSVVVNGVRKTVTKLQWRNVEKVKNLLLAIYPYAREKKIQIECAFSYLSLPWRQFGRGGLRVPLSQDQRDIDAMHATEIKYLKPRYWRDYGVFSSDEELSGFAFEKVCELHPN